MSDYSDMASRVRDYKNELKDEHETKTRESMQRMKIPIRGKIRENNSVARSNLVRDVRDSRVALEQYFAGHSVHVPEWAKYLEHGTGQVSDGTKASGAGSYDSPDGWADIEAIETWVTSKNITPRYYDTQSELARAIARTIGAIGNFPHPFLRPVWSNNSVGYQTVIDANVQAFSDAWRNTR